MSYMFDQSKIGWNQPVFESLVMGENMKKILIALTAVLLLGVIFIIPALAFDTDLNVHHYKWTESSVKCNESINYNKQGFTISSAAPVFQIDGQSGKIGFNSIISAYSLKPCSPEFFSKTDNTSNITLLGMNTDVKIPGASLWFSGLYGNNQFNSIKNHDNYDSSSAYLVAAGADTEIGGTKLHGHFFYAAGNDSVNYNNDDISSFNSPSRNLWIGQPYYSAEIMGYGKLDSIVPSKGSLFDSISSVAALNLGASIKPMDKLTLRGDIWYAKLADKKSEQNSLGSEIDLVVTYELIEDLKFDIIGAYLFSGDASSTKLAPGGQQLKNESGSYPYELGARLSLSF